MNEATYEAIAAEIAAENTFTGHTTIFSPCGLFSAPNPAAEAAADDWYYADKALQELRAAGVKEGVELFEAWYGEADVDENELRAAIDDVGF